MTTQTTKPTNTREEIQNAHQDTTDWSALTTKQRVSHMEVEGYVVLPNLLTSNQLQCIRDELDRLPTIATDYSQQQRGNKQVEATDSPNAIACIDHPGIGNFLDSLFGDQLICTTITYSLSLPGHPGIAIHTDAQPYGSKTFGMQASSPVLARVLIYLDDLTAECSPLKVVPRSHLSLHADANPYNRYLNHPEEVMVCCQAGSAAIINQKIFHANYPNYSDKPRRMLAIAYRPAWAGPIDDIPDRDPEVVAKLPENIRPYFASLNTRRIDFNVPNRPDNLDRPAPGLGQHRLRD